MSRRPDKKLNRLRRALTKTESTTSWIDLIDWLKSRGHAKSAGEARQMLADGRVKVNANTVGRVWDSEFGRWMVFPYCASALRSELRVTSE